MVMIHLIRHGETDGNGTHYVGRRDLPLNAIGEAQATALADRLAAHPITRVIASPLRRAVQTARPLAARLGRPVELAPALIEIDFGTLQDLPKAGHALDLRKQHPVVPLPGGESLRNVWDRLLPFVATLDPHGGAIAVVGHYWSNRMLYGLLAGHSFDQTLQNRSYKPRTGTSVAIAVSHTPRCPPTFIAGYSPESDPFDSGNGWNT